MTLKPSQEWWTAAEIAEARLPDMPGTTQRVTTNATDRGWRSQASFARRRSGKGGGWEYHWTLFPSRAQAYLVARAKPVEAPPPSKVQVARDEVWTWFEKLPEKVKKQAATRLATIQKAEALERGGLTRELAVEDAARIDGVSERTVWNWLGMISGVRSDDRLPYLAPRHRAAVRKSRRSEIDPYFGDLIKADFLRPEQPSLTSVYDRAVRIANAKNIPVVPIHTVRRWIDRTVSRTTLTYARKGFEALKRLRPTQVRDRSGLHALEGVNGDFHKFDLFVRFPATPSGQKEEVCRPQMVGFQDLLSGKLLAYQVDRTPNSHAVQLCIGDMIEQWGIPEHVLMDNGREFAAKLITGGAPTRNRFKIKTTDMPGLLVSLGCQIHWATPYSGQSKPIERAWRDLCDRVSKHPAFAGAYTGNKPDAKPENYGSAAVPLDTFLAVLKEEIALHNARPDRRSEVAYGRSFDEVFAESYAVSPIRKATAEQRRLWLMGAEGIQSHARTGQVNFMGNRYHADWMIEIAGQRIVARFDRAALWDGLHIYSMADAYLGFAPCTVKSGFFDVDDARTHKRAVKDWKSAQKAELAAHRRLTAADVADAVAALPPVATEAPEAKVIKLFDQQRSPVPAPVRADEAAAHSAIIAEFAARSAPEPEQEAGGRETYARALEIERQIAAGGKVTKDQQIWLAGYQTTSDYRVWAAMVSDFDESILKS